MLASPKVQQEVEPKVRFDTKKEANEYVKFQRSKGHGVTNPIKIPWPANRRKAYDLDGKVMKYCYVVRPLPVMKTLPRDYLPKALGHDEKRVQEEKVLDRGIQEIVNKTDGKASEDIRKAGKYLSRRQAKP